MSGAGVRLGGAHFELTADAGPLQAAMARAEQTTKQGAARINASVEGINRANTQAAGGFGALTRSALGFGAAAAGIGGAAVLVGQAISGIAASTKAAQQAQFALNKTYGDSAGPMAQFAKQFADQIGRSNTEVQQAAVIVGNLTKEYGLNQAQAQQLVVQAADLAAVYGKDLPDAVQRLQAAIRGEAESAEALGLVLNDEAVAVRQLGQEHKGLFGTLTDADKAQLRLAEATRQLGERTGAAAERAAGASGAFDRLGKATDELGAAIGSRLLGPASAVANTLALMATNATRALDAFSDLSNMDLAKLNQLAAILAVIVNPVGGVAALIGSGFLTPGTPSAAGPYDREAGPTPAEVSAAQETERAVREIKEKARRRADLEAQKDAADAKAEAEIEAIEKERDAKEQWYDEERARIEARRHYHLEDIEQRKEAALAALEAEKQASADAFAEQIKRAEREKQLRIETAQAAHDAAESAIEDRRRLNDAARQAEDRGIRDARVAEDRARADAIEAEDTARETAHRDELRRLESRHDAVMAGLKAEEQEVRRVSERRLRAIDRQMDAARRASDARLRDLDALADKEDDRHRAAMRALDDELDARKRALDLQLDALDAAERAEDAARRSSDLRKRLTEAEGAAAKARGTGTPEEIAQAREELTRALRVGNETSIANARERLAQLAGQGNEAIKRADEELAEAQEAIRQAGVDDARDAERDKLNAAKSAIDAEGEARKRAEDDRTRERKRELDADKQAERDRLAARLDGLEKKKRATQDSTDREIEAIRERTERERESYEAATESAKDAFREQSLVIDQRREVEDRAIDDRRLAEDRERSDRRDAEDEALRVRKSAIDAALEQERRDAEEHYNGPNGVITQLRQASRDSEREYSRRLSAARASFEAERKAAELIYRNPEGNGQLQLLEKAREAEFKSLEESKRNWQQWSKDVQASIKAAMDGLSASPGDARAGPRAASGRNTATSTARTASGSSGRDVQGDVVSWLNDAMDITGVSDDWLAGLQWLMKKESSGDPHAKNPGSTASGLFQLIDSTWEENRDRKLPNDVFDPVANAVAAIRYIKKRYGSPSEAIRFWQANNWYDGGHLFLRPTLTYTPATGERAVIAEKRPEMLLGGGMTAARMIDRSSLVGPMPQRDQAAVGRSLSAMAAPAGGGPVSTSVVNFNGLTYEEAERRQRRQQHRDKLLRGVAVLGGRR